MKKLFLIIGLFCGALSLSAACSFSQGEDDSGRKTMTMENSRIKVVLMPECNGRIAEIAIKEDGEERHFFPELEFSTVEVGNGISLVGKSNYAGLEDWGWEEGMVKKNVPYKAEVLKNTPDEITVRFSAVFSSWANLERVMTITRDSAAVKITTSFTNIDKKPISRSYWQHIMVDFDRNMDLAAVRFFIPVKQTGENGKVLGGEFLQRPGKDCVLERKAGTSHPKSSDYSRLAQPWRAMVYEDMLFGMVVDLKKFQPHGAAYHYVKDVLSCENIFNKTLYQPGETHSFSSTIIVGYVPERVDFMDENVILGCTRLAENGKLALNISAYRSGAQKNMQLTFSAVDKSGKVVETLSCEGEFPAAGDAFARKLTFKKAPADSRLTLKVAANGKLLAESELLDQIKW